MEEIWKDVENYEGLYQVSNLGRVKSLRVKRHKDGILILGEHNGYPCVFLHKDKKRHWKMVHRLVAQAFIPKVEGKDCIDHIDGNTRNNNVSNLRWCTNQENLTFPLALKHRSEAVLGDKNPFFGKKHSNETKEKISNSRIGKYSGSNNPFFGKKHSEETRRKISEARRNNGTPIIQLTLDGKLVKVWEHAKAAGVELGLSPKRIRECCKHIRNNYKGFCWEYKS